MTWKQLKEFLERLDENQLAEQVAEVIPTERGQEVWHLHICIAPKQVKDDTFMCGDIKENMPYLKVPHYQPFRGER